MSSFHGLSSFTLKSCQRSLSWNFFEDIQRLACCPTCTMLLVYVLFSHAVEYFLSPFSIKFFFYLKSMLLPKIRNYKPSILWTFTICFWVFAVFLILILNKILFLPSINASAWEEIINPLCMMNIHNLFFEFLQSKFPTLSRLYETYKALPEFQASSPQRQPDAFIHNPWLLEHLQLLYFGCGVTI